MRESIHLSNATAEQNIILHGQAGLERQIHHDDCFSLSSPGYQKFMLLALHVMPVKTQA